MANSVEGWLAELAEAEGFIITYQVIKRGLSLALSCSDGSFARLEHQAQQVMGNVMGFMTSDQALNRMHLLAEVIAQYRFHAQSLDAIGVHHDLRLLFLRVLLCHGWRCGSLVHQGIVEELVPGVLINCQDVLRRCEVQALV